MRFQIFTIVCLLIFFSSSCKRKVKGIGEPAPAPVVKITSPALFVQQEIEKLTDFAKFQSTGDGNLEICGADIDTIQKTPKVVVDLLFRNNIVCESEGFKIRRSGKVTIERDGSTLWTNKNAKVKLIFKDFRIFNACDTCKTDALLIQVQGEMLRKNMTGGDYLRLEDGQTVIHKLTAFNLSYTFADSSKRIQNINQLFTYQKESSQTLVSISGDTTIRGVNNISIWGKIWNGKDFYVSIPKPKVYKICDGKGKIISGEQIISKGNEETKEFYGVDLQGNFKGDCSAQALLTIITQGDEPERREIYPY